MMLTKKVWCFDEQTDVMTEEGFLNWSLVNEQTKLAQYDKETQEITFDYPLKIHKNFYEGTMIQIKTLNSDLMITPGHKQIVKRKEDNSTEVLSAQELFFEEKEVCLINHVKPIAITNINYLTENLINSIGTYLSCLNASQPVEPKEQGYNLGDFSYQLYNDCTDSDGNLQVPIILRVLNKRQFGWFLEGLKSANYFAEEIDSFSTKSKKLANQLQFLYFINGYICTVREKIDRKDLTINYSVQVSYPADEYIKPFHVRKNNKQGGKDINIENQLEYKFYKGKTFSANISDKFLIVKRSGKISISGN